ncbi:hypothetical protein MMC29_008548 [Sticta canariensis]|nr:hypothetical protein [Sticta canariensis]
MASRPCSSSFVLTTTILAWLFMMMEATKASYINYTTVTAYFLQDDPATNASTFDYADVDFGLIDRAYDTDAEFDPGNKKTQWQRFEHQVLRLNCQSGKHVQYKLLYMGRHGEGYHNVAEAFYGTPAWDCYWSELDGNSTSNWSDAHLTEKGIQQAQKANGFWAQMIATQKIPTPESYYTSPLDRCLATADVTFSTLKLPSGHAFVPEVKELLREAIGIHTCDRRSSKSYIHSTYPSFVFEPNFAETDPLWTADERETDSAQQARLKRLLDDLFTHDRSTFISLTSHSGSIAAILRAVGHRPFGLVTGAVIPVLVRAETIQGSAPSTSIAPSTSAPTCTVDPTPSSGA